MKEHEHNFTHVLRKGISENAEYVVIYCTKCGVVSFDQAKAGIDGEYQKLLTKPIIS